jgi:sugar phosphate isomerase/epimerase
MPLLRAYEIRLHYYRTRSIDEARIPWRDQHAKEALTDKLRLLPGLGVVPIGPVCGRLKRIGYDGWCSVEHFREEYWRRDPFALARQAFEASVKVLRFYFTLDDIESPS